MAILQLDPPLPLTTPKGPGWAHLVIDYGTEADLVWVVIQDQTGEVWSWRNQEVRGQKNITMGRPVVSGPPQIHDNRETETDA